MNLFKSVPKNKSSVFNSLQAKLTGSNPVALTTFPQMDCGSKYNDLANNSLKTLSNIKPSIRFWSDFTPKLIREIRSKLGVFSPKIVCKSLLDFFQQSQNKFSVTGKVSKIVFFYLYCMRKRIYYYYNKRNWLGDYNA